ncbi:citrate lyase subunit alpha / citrate CoA-transferase [Anaerovirgula multivorans]|uniref:Citrate lyase alpha chain n=1 Tax=Anaerovirgula multivorans TaxID=312168 RepID=A0A239K832_9FIRM|nr:citrate lyase subunit alpha [Anaerovirgula multivorans]SNT14110.1 citrate lyase subunit alpha / citrate CoA-transferase [Anaerovirgula multivorans]
MSNMIKNAINREIPKYIEGIGELKAFGGAFAYNPEGKKAATKIPKTFTGKNKIIENIKTSLELCGIKNGMTISFHHHFRNGDYLVNMVVEEIDKMGIRDITLAASSLQSIHAPLIDYIKKGVITGIQTSGIRGKLGEVVSREKILDKPIIIRSHGGRPRAIESGETKIDIAFIAAPAADAYGNVNGVEGPTACGAMGYAMTDAEYADKVVVVTDYLVPYPACPISITQTLVDYVVVVDEIGNPKGIVSDATRITKNPMELLIAQKASEAIITSGLIREGFSFQAGSGGASLGVAHFLRQKMRQEGITGSFAAGGITGYLVDMLEEGLFKSLLDVQCFDLKAIESIKNNPNHMEMSASFYANPHNKGCVANQLDIMVLSATEIDLDFNVNVITGSNGIVMGASGGHSDTAAGSKLSIVVAPLLRGRLPIVVDEATNVITPGETIDAVITERGIAVNPKRKDLLDLFKDAKLGVMSIYDLKEIAEKLVGKPRKIETTDEIVGLIEYRDGTIIDTIRRAK